VVTGPSSRGTLSPTTLYRRDLLCEFGGWPTGLGSHEVSFILQALGLKAGVAYTPKPLFVFFIRHSSFGHSERADRAKTQSLYRRYVAMMDEPPFAGLFSKTFAERWLAANWNN